MRRFLRFVGLALLLLVVAAGVFAAYVAVSGIPKYPPGRIERRVEITPERVERGRKIAGLSCLSCHQNPTTGKLTGKQNMDVPKQFGIVFSKNITRDPVHGIGSWTDGELMYFLRTGVHRTGQYVPPYMPKFPLLSDDDLESIVAFLRSDDSLTAPSPEDPPGRSHPSFLTKFLAHTVFKPLPYPKERIPMPSPADRVAYGRYLSSSLGCFTCHSADFKTMNELEPEKSEGYFGGGNALLDQRGETVVTANITFDQATGIGRWTEEEFDRALRTGVRPDRTVLLYPMEPMPDLTREDTAALYAFLQSVPKRVHAVARPARQPVAADASEGKKLYYKYGCPACHGDQGVGIGDLRQAAAH
ncbi:MAG: c-type cytochrome, partial [Thermoanaerobaculia bacterium]